MHGQKNIKVFCFFNFNVREHESSPILNKTTRLKLQLYN